ncbi:MAG: class I SAM-dependent methyltransferase [Candidatus Omnitrophica bacterium]|nr:class I SAM-dependent methyltransferase [Candidatus Omnitrophota bacterium]
MNKAKEVFLYEMNSIDKLTYKGCPYCDKTDGEIMDSPQTARAFFYDFKKCSHCSLIYPFPRVTKETLRQYFLLMVGAVKQKAIMPKVYKFLKYIGPNSKILDVGAGHGEAGNYLKKRGCEVDAAEVNHGRAEYLRSKGFKVYEGAFEDVEIDEKYDVIILSQVLMHLFSIKEAILKIRKLLKDNGLLITSQMNFNSIVQQTVRSASPGRLNAFSISSYFTKESLCKILHMEGFKIKKVIFRKMSFFQYFFLSGYPKFPLLFRFMDYVIKNILAYTETSDYFTVIAKLDRKPG